MMRFPWRLDEQAQVAHESALEIDSKALPGVRFSVLRMSFGRRTELLQRIRPLAGQINYFESSEKFQEQVDANLLGQEIENLYLRWGLVEIKGLLIDGEPATPELLIDKGPEELSKEIVAAVRAQCGLTEQERKN
jgi:hypothetical protein